MNMKRFTQPKVVINGHHRSLASCRFFAGRTTTALLILELIAEALIFVIEMVDLIWYQTTDARMSEFLLHVHDCKLSSRRGPVLIDIVHV